MDYVSYLTPVAMEIRQLVQQKIRIIENSSICKKTTYFGYIDTRRRELSICTARILLLEMRRVISMKRFCMNPFM